MILFSRLLFRQPRHFIISCLLQMLATLITLISLSAWHISTVQQKVLESTHTTIALINGDNYQEMSQKSQLGWNIVDKKGSRHWADGTISYSHQDIFDIASDSPYTKASVTNSLLAASLLNIDSISSGTTNPLQYNAGFDNFTHSFCVLAIRCVDVNDCTSRYSVSTGNLVSYRYDRYTAVFEVIEPLSIDPSYKGTITEGTLIETLLGKDLYTNDRRCPFNVGKTYIIRGFLELSPSKKLIHADGTITQNNGSSNSYFYFTNPAFDGLLNTGHYQEKGLKNFLVKENVVHSDPNDADYISDSLDSYKAIYHTVPENSLPFWSEYDGPLYDYLQSLEGSIWKNTIIPWAHLNQNSASLLLTDDIMTLQNFNTGYASLVSGRFITPKEYSNGANVCLISSFLANHNQLQVGDTIDVELYTTEFHLGSASQVFHYENSGKLLVQEDVVWQRFPILLADSIDLKKSYTIVGIYSAPEYATGYHNFTAETIFVPKASVPNAELYENPRVNFCNAIVLENGTEDAFEAYMAEQGAGGYFSYFDMGYAELHASYSALAASARRLMLLSLAVLTLAAAVYHLLWLRRFAPAVRTARLLGVSAKTLQKELFAVLSAMALIITATGMGGALLLYDAVIAALVGEIPRNTGALLLFAGLLLVLLILTAALCTYPPSHQNLMRNPVRRKKRSRTVEKIALQGAADSILPSLEPAAFTAQPALAVASPDISTGAAQTKALPSGRTRIFSPSMQSITLRTVRRRRGMFALLGAVVLVGMAGSFLLHWQIGRQQTAWQKSQTMTDVLCIITDAQGSGQDILDLPVQQVKELLFGELSGWVREVNALSADVLLAPEGYSVRRILSFVSDPALSPLAGASVTMLSGWDESFFATEQAVCLVPEGTAVTAGADGGRYITMQGLDGIPTRLQVIGVVAGGPQNTIHIPLFMPNTEGELPPFVVDSCSFSLADNTRLEESRATLYRHFVDPRDPDSNKDNGYGLLVHDETYLDAKAGVESNIALLRLLLPVLTAGMGILGFLATMLCTNSRKREFAVMRCLGVRRGAIFALVMEEQLLCALAGAAVALCIGALLPGALPGMAWLSAGGILLVFLAGGAFAALRVSSANVMQLMKTEG